ncbi:fatty acyl-CoA reductase 1-like isoform X2 [Harpegnathos saltator]|uniref:fatty acyl-CoA reductase 1-like isoform X2 n=1 Tax=Harpegnathos saltator TaxID=610380 RepID=UPI000DBEEF70|nr:fatty acyl-CoA reductase 1-like isoform X2 [Harpegnathos saltator]
MDSLCSIPAFYSGKSVFITGATGFLGKSLIEKLLRSCPDIKEIFLLMRPKKDMNIEERLRKLLTNALFDTLRREQPHCFDKLIPIKGDIAIEDLGLSDADRNILIQKTSVIFHIAANVRFDITLKMSVLQNVKTTRDICILGEHMKNLVALVHVSTVYSQLDKQVIDEIVYPAEVDWKKMIQVVETLDEQLLEVFKSKYMGCMPNSYIFSKKLAEQVIVDYSESLPCVILRPSIVTATLSEPVKGWMDNFNGPVALVIGIAKGLLRIMYADINIYIDIIPADTFSKSTIVASWKCGVRKRNMTINFPLVYNCTMSHDRCPTNKDIVNLYRNCKHKNPFGNLLWYPQVYFTKNLLFYNLLFILFQVIPFWFIDELLRLSGRQPRLMALQRKIFINNYLLAHFVLNNWDIRNERAISLSDEIPNDQQEFGYRTVLSKGIDVPYIENSITGAKIYLLNERMDHLDAAKSQLNRRRTNTGSRFV